MDGLLGDRTAWSTLDHPVVRWPCLSDIRTVAGIAMCGPDHRSDIGTGSAYVSLVTRDATRGGWLTIPDTGATIAWVGTHRITASQVDMIA